MSITFQKPSLEEIQALIQKELKEIPLKNLEITVNDKQGLSPIYTQTEKNIHLSNLLDYKVIFQLFSLNNSFTKNNNDAILQALENGQNGLILDFRNEVWSFDQLNSLFNNIRLDFIHVEFLNLHDETEKNIGSFLKGYPFQLNWSNTALSKDVFCISDNNFFEAAAQFISSFRSEKAFIHIELSGDYFRDIAKIRAFKSMLCQHRRLERLTSDFIIIGDTNLTNKSQENTENNLLKLTTEAMSALIGGCEGVWIHPHDNQINSNFSPRIARNIFHLMQEESYLHLVDDVSSGSYFIENYTEVMAREIYAALNA